MLKIPSPVLREMQEKSGFALPSGQWVGSDIAGAIGWDYAEALYGVVRQYRPAAALEIGFASAVSGLAILTALAENGPDGRLTSIDPFQATDCRGAGTFNVGRAGLADRHRLLESPDYVALPKLLADGERFDLVYIDGNHDLEHVILDAFYADQLLNPGGLMGFNDCGHRSVHAAMRHVPPRSRYAEVDVGLGKDYRGRNPLVSAERWVTGRSSSDRYFRKAGAPATG
jgi:predicted O-methyltransferase YrrM